MTPEFQRTDEFEALGWRDACIDRDFRSGWSTVRPTGRSWSDEAREHVARRTPRNSYRSIEEAVAAWSGESRDAVEAEFDELAAVWRQETAGAPFVVTRVTHWAYQRIIGMGPKVVPLILKDLQRETNHWYWALNAITGEDPAEGVLHFDEAAARWLDWGRRSGLLDEANGA